MTAMTYQAASGAGAQNMRELLAQMGAVARGRQPICWPIRRRRSSTSTGRWPSTLRARRLPDRELRRAAGRQPDPLDRQGPGQRHSRARSGRAAPRRNKILGRRPSAPGTFRSTSLCVRIGAMRCHSQALTIKLKQGCAARRSQRHHRVRDQWVKIIPNTREALRCATCCARQ
jgi:aspartate-semialdehyde dehydrogenase